MQNRRLDSRARFTLTPVHAATCCSPRASVLQANERHFLPPAAGQVSPRPKLFLSDRRCLLLTPDSPTPLSPPTFGTRPDICSAWHISAEWLNEWVMLVTQTRKCEAVFHSLFPHQMTKTLYLLPPLSSDLYSFMSRLVLAYLALLPTETSPPLLSAASCPFWALLSLAFRTVSV